MQVNITKTEKNDWSVQLQLKRIQSSLNFEYHFDDSLAKWGLIQKGPNFYDSWKASWSEFVMCTYKGIHSLSFSVNFKPFFSFFIFPFSSFFVSVDETGLKKVREKERHPFSCCRWTRAWLAICSFYRFCTLRLNSIRLGVLQSYTQIGAPNLASFILSIWHHFWEWEAALVFARAIP